jgi:tetratricopeptide (TPR) repeat protein
MSDQTAADLNNVGVAYLESGDLKKALEFFRDALRQTMGELRPAPPAAAPAPAALTGSSRSTSGNNGGAIQAEYLALPRSEQKPQSSSNSNVCPFVHAQGFGIVGTPGSYSPDPLINTTVISTIVIFNLAAVYHLKGLHEKALSDRRLLKAHSLYEKANVLLTDAGVTYGFTGNAVVDLLSMALSNNLAHVCHELGQYDRSRSHFDSLIRFALTVIPSRYGDHYVGSVLDQQKSNFLLNAIILHAPSLAPAA